MTPADICRDALLQGGIISLSQTIYAEDILKAFGQLNSMLAQWNNVRFNVSNLIDLHCTATGNQSYTIGATPGSDIETPRPDKIMAAYARMLPVAGNQPVDCALQILQAHEDYAEIMLKTLQGFPVMAFWDSAFPVGRLYVYPIPQVGQFEIHVVLKQQITSFANLSEQITMPPEYTDAMIWNLAVRLRPIYKLPADPTVQGMALQSLTVVKGANAQVALLKMPWGVGNRGGSGASWYYTGGFA